MAAMVHEQPLMGPAAAPDKEISYIMQQNYRMERTAYMEKGLHTQGATNAVHPFHELHSTRGQQCHMHESYAMRA